MERRVTVSPHADPSLSGLPENQPLSPATAPRITRKTSRPPMSPGSTSRPPRHPEAPPGPVFKGAVWELPGTLPFPFTAPCVTPAASCLHPILPSPRPPLKALDLFLTATQGPSQPVPLTSAPLLAGHLGPCSPGPPDCAPALPVCLCLLPPLHLYFQLWPAGCRWGAAGRQWPTPFVFHLGQVLSPVWSAHPLAHHNSGLLGPTTFVPTKCASQHTTPCLAESYCALWTGQKRPRPPQTGLCGTRSQGPTTGLYWVSISLGHMLYM